MNRKTPLIVGGALLALCLVVGVVALVIWRTASGLTQPATDAGDRFMQSLKGADYAGAYALMAPALQRKMGDAHGLQVMIESNRAQPTQWTFTQRRVSGILGRVRGTATFAAGGAGAVSLDLAKSSDGWQITGFDLTPQY